MRSLLVAILALTATSLFAQVPDSISYQFFIRDTTDVPVSGPVNLLITMYTDAAGTIPVWSVDTVGFQLDGGVGNINIGLGGALRSLTFNQPYWIGMRINGGAETPLTQLVSAPYALAVRGMHAVWVEDTQDASFNITAGGPGNVVSSTSVGSTIGGGGGVALSQARPNSVDAYYGTVGGGAGNSIEPSSGLPLRWSTIGGGLDNTISAHSGTIAGGAANTVNGGGGTVGGGLGNIAFTKSVVSGGEGNSTTGNNATVGGGFGNSAGWNAAVGGGVSNTANGFNATISGGSGNVASGQSAAVPGGMDNHATGAYSLAGGFKAKAIHEGAFVWNDRSMTFGNDSLVSTANNQFLARAAGGFKFLTEPVPGDTVGAELASGSGSWASLSSETSKTAFSEIDSRDYLERVAALEVKEWSYKTEQGVTHVGPMAEDFYARFGHGPTERSITTVDADGVALAAIQGLYELVREQQTLLDGQQAEIERMRAVMARAGLE